MPKWRTLLPWVLAAALAACGEDGTPAAATQPPSSAEIVDSRSRFERLEGFWSEGEARAILDRTERLEITADVSHLTAGEREALERLFTVGEIVQRLYEDARHPQALAVRAHLEALEVEEAERERLASLRSLYELFQGPIAIRAGERVAFAPVSPYEPGRNVYPSGATAEELARWAEAHPGSGILDVRTVVRRRTLENLVLDRGRRDDHPVIEVLHPWLRDTLRDGPDPSAFYAVPYALAYARELVRAYGLLREAAELVRADDGDLADYLEQRARDLLSNDYEAGDAAWVTGRFERLNAQIGAYETYDDHLLGQKAFFGMSILVRARDESAADIERAIARLPEYEAALPGGPYERVRTELPIGIYDVLADFGQARGVNTASILPNEAHAIRKYGRTILIRRNILMAPAIASVRQRHFAAVVTEAQAGDLGELGYFDRTVWHEVGHYLGPKRTSDGRDVTEALGNLHNHVEELKADLVSLWLIPRLVEAGVMDQARARSAYAAGVLRTLVTSRPQRENAYATMQLMQQNWLLEHGALAFSGGRLTIDYGRYPAAVERMLAEVLRIQRAGDRAAAEAFVERWARWDESVQGVLGAALDGIGPRYWLASYPALED